MSVLDPPPVDDHIERLMNPLNEQSPQSSLEQTASNKSGTTKAQVQPAVVTEANMDEINTLSSPSSSSKQTPVSSTPADQRRSFSIPSNMMSFATSIRSTVTVLCCEPKVWIVIIVVLILEILISLFYYSLVELHVGCLSLGGWGIIACSKSFRGKLARQPDIQIPENKRNPYRDIPSLNDDNPLEPTCPRLQQEPTEQVYHADVHNPDLSTTHSSPSTSTAAKGVDTQGASGGHPPSTPSTSKVVAAVNVHVTPQDTEKKEESSEKDS